MFGGFHAALDLSGKIYDGAISPRAIGSPSARCVNRESERNARPYGLCAVASRALEWKPRQVGRKFRTDLQISQTKIASTIVCAIRNGGSGLSGAFGASACSAGTLRTSCVTSTKKLR